MLQKSVNTSNMQQYAQRYLLLKETAQASRLGIRISVSRQRPALHRLRDRGAAVAVEARRRWVVTELILPKNRNRTLEAKGLNPKKANMQPKRSWQKGCPGAFSYLLGWQTCPGAYCCS